MAKHQILLNFNTSKSLAFAWSTDVLYVVDLVGICVALVYVGFVLEKEHREESFQAY